MDHVQELRNRLFIVAGVFLLGTIVAYIYREEVTDVLVAPLDGQKLIYLNVAGGFSFIFLVTIYTGMAVAMPLLIQQLYSFVSPILPKEMRRYSARILLASFFLLISGIAFGYFIAAPGAFRFLSQFASNIVESALTTESYLNFIVAYTIGIGLVFQLPLLLLLIHWIKPFTPKGLLSSERWVIVLAFVVAALITPTPDPLNQAIVALPVIIVYQFGVITILISIRNAKKRAAKVTPVAAIPLPELKREPTPLTTSVAPLPATKKMPRSIDGTLAKTRRPQPVMKSIPARELPRRLPDYSPRPLSTRRTSMSLDGISRVLPT